VAVGLEGAHTRVGSGVWSVISASVTSYRPAPTVCGPVL
jgi:hypothetical protein